MTTGHLHCLQPKGLGTVGGEARPGNAELLRAVAALVKKESWTLLQNVLCMETISLAFQDPPVTGGPFHSTVYGAQTMHF